VLGIVPGIEFLLPVGRHIVSDGKQDICVRDFILFLLRTDLFVNTPGEVWKS
jgi:hypothetical protein